MHPWIGFKIKFKELQLCRTKQTSSMDKANMTSCDASNFFKTWAHSSFRAESSDHLLRVPGGKAMAMLPSGVWVTMQRLNVGSAAPLESEASVGAGSGLKVAAPTRLLPVFQS